MMLCRPSFLKKQNHTCIKSDESIHFQIIAKTSDKTTNQENEEQCKHAPHKYDDILHSHCTLCDPNYISRG
ncbi:hypothetical protein QVD17_03881 [Tagetes erecta]|uniref:Uncharacterized protein n=1 Tax=Tagetes erecta TaxID=13708 RepID=A0AAD8P924_TARER|nr:hypothetical protein QVD17_03881 [Tagetes erecta]